MAGKLRSVGKDLQSHIMFSMSYMIPLIMGGTVVLAIARFIGLGMGVSDLKTLADTTGFGHVLYQINVTATYAINLIPVIIGAYVAYSIGDKPALGAGLVGGYAAMQNQSGFLGALVVGIVSGYVVKWAKEYINVPEKLTSLKAVIILPGLGMLTSVLIMGVLLADPLAALNTALQTWLTDLCNNTSSQLILSTVIGAMVAFDLGGPVNKAANTVCNALMAEGIYYPKVIEIGEIITAPLGYFFATLIHRKRFSAGLREAGVSAGIMSIFGLSEGAIPFTMISPLKLVPLNCLASIVGGACEVLLGVYAFMPPAGGMYGFITYGNPVAFFISIIVGGMVIGLFAPLLVKFNDDEASEKISEDDIDIDFEFEPVTSAN